MLEFTPADRPGETYLYWEKSRHRSVFCLCIGCSWREAVSWCWCVSMWLLFLSQADQRQGVRHRQRPTLVHRLGNQTFNICLYGNTNNCFTLDVCPVSSCALYVFVRWHIRTRGRTLRKTIGKKRSPPSEWLSHVSLPCLVDIGSSVWFSCRTGFCCVYSHNKSCWYRILSRHACCIKNSSELWIPAASWDSCRYVTLSKLKSSDSAAKIFTLFTRPCLCLLIFSLVTAV